MEDEKIVYLLVAEREIDRMVQKYMANHAFRLWDKNLLEMYVPF